MSLDYEMNGIFPVPIYFTKLKKFTDMELKVIRLMENQSAKNMGNSRSDDTFVLKSKHFENIRKQLMSHVKQYFDKVISTSDKIVPYITQSWINYTRKGEYHHSHAHPNSIISGVFYFDCDNDSIKFSNPVFYQTIKPLIKSYNSWNSETWSFSTKKGQLFMFPSSLIHQVDIKKGTNTRTSLSFNTFYKGILGSNVTLTELIL